MPDYKSFVKKGTFLHDYLQYMSTVETPIAYDFWSAMWLVGNACGRLTFVDRPRAPVYLNWYVILVADSGVTRKSSAVRVASKLALAISDKVEPPFEVVQAKVTPEMLEWKLHELSKDFGSSHCAIAVSELISVLGKERYTRTMPGLLTDLYDSDSSRRGGGSLSRGKRDATNVFVSLLSASTPSWLQSAVNPDIVEGGFTSRTLFVISEQPKRLIAWPEESDADGECIQRLETHLRGMRDSAKRFGRIALSDGGLEHFTRWYGRRRLSRDAFRSSFESREDAHVLRLAACLCINDDRWIIDANDIKISIRLIAAVKEDSAALFEGSTTHSKYIAGVDAIRTLLVSAGMSGVAQQRITVGVQHYLKAGDARIALEIMHELGMVQKFEGIKTGRGRPKTLWRATKQLTAPGALEQVLQEIEPT